MARSSNRTACTPPLLRFARRDRQIKALFWIDETMRPIVEMARRTFDRAIELEIDLDAGSAAVMGDSSQVEHLVMNLVLNARDAIVGKGRVAVRTRLQQIAAGDERGGLPAGTYVALEVADDGSGIDPAIRERIFEPYFTTKTQGAVKGTGLGLSIVHRIVESHGGFIDLLDGDPKGTVVRVLLPSSAAPERSEAE